MNFPGLEEAKMGWFERAKQALSRGSSSSAGTGIKKRSATGRRLGKLEELEPRLVLSHVAPGLVDAPQTYSGALDGKIVFTSAGHGWHAGIECRR